MVGGRGGAAAVTLMFLRKIYTRYKQLVTPATCLANRGLVRLAMKRFRGAVEDLGGERLKATAAKLLTMVAKKVTPDGGVVDRGIGGKGGSAAAGTKTGGGETTLTGGGLDTLDCQLGRALAEGRLQNGASREVNAIFFFRMPQSKKPTQIENSRVNQRPLMYIVTHQNVPL